MNNKYYGYIYETFESYRWKEGKYRIMYHKNLKKDLYKCKNFDEVAKKVVEAFPDHLKKIKEETNKEVETQIAYNKCKNKLVDLIKLKEKEIKGVKDFEELIKIINDFNVGYMGELRVYDIALALGIYLDKMPTDKVYMHSAPRDTAKKILGDKYEEKVLSINKEKERAVCYINIDEFPCEFSAYGFNSYLIEDVLCCKKNQLSSIARQRKY